MARQFLKRIAIAFTMTLVVMVAFAVAWNFVVPAVLNADYDGITSEVMQTSDNLVQGASETVDKIRESPAVADTTDRSKDKTRFAQTEISEPEIDPYEDAVQDRSSSAAVSGTVTKIVDGDTLDVDGNRIRLSLVNTPEKGEPGYAEATSFLRHSCPVGTSVAYDLDDGQRQGSHGRMIAKVWCFGHPPSMQEQSINYKLVIEDHAEILDRFCSKSEFGRQAWAQESGC